MEEVLLIKNTDVCILIIDKFLGPILLATAGPGSAYIFIYRNTWNTCKLTCGFWGDTWYNRGWLIIAHEGIIINHQGDIQCNREYCRGDTRDYGHSVTIFPSELCRR